MRFTLKSSLLVACLFLVVTPVLVATYFFTREEEEHFLQQQTELLQIWTKKIDSRVEGDFHYYLQKAGVSENASRDEKIAALDKALTPLIETIGSGHKKVQIGIYSKDLEALVATCPEEFRDNIGDGIPSEHPGWKALKGKTVITKKCAIHKVSCVLIPLRRNGEVIGYVFANRNLSYIEGYLWKIRINGLIIGVISLLTGLSITMLLYKKLFKQIDDLVQGIKALSVNLSARLPVPKGELGEVAVAINNLAATLDNNQDFTELLVENSIGGIIAVDKEGIIKTFNKKAGALCCVAPADYLGKPYRDFARRFGPEEESLLLKTLATGETFYNVMKEVNLPHRVGTGSFYTHLIRSRQGQIEGAVIFMFDLTEKMAMEEKLRQADKFSVVGQLAAGTAHEIRNPLTSIRGFLQLMEERYREDQTLQEYVGIMTAEIDRINSITTEFLLLAKPSHPKRCMVDITQVIREITVLLESEALLRNVQLETGLNQWVPEINVDPEQIKQVFLNLANNAIEAMAGDGKLTINVRYCPQKEVLTEEGPRVMDVVAVSFHNTGPQIPPEALEKIFDPFYTTKDECTGLGLTVTYQIVRNHGGNITVESNPAGTTFTVELPAGRK